MSFEVRKGEILGVSGLMGAGRTELFMSILGCYGDQVSGQLTLEDQLIKNLNPKNIIEKGISYLSEDRKGNGLVLSESVRKNMSMASLDNISNWGIIDESKEIRQTEKYVADLLVKTPHIRTSSRKFKWWESTKSCSWEMAFNRP